VLKSSNGELISDIIIVVSGNIPFGYLMGFSVFLQLVKVKNATNMLKASDMKIFKDNFFIYNLLKRTFKCKDNYKVLKEKPGGNPVLRR